MRERVTNARARKVVACIIETLDRRVPCESLPYLAWCAAARRILCPSLGLKPFESRAEACRWLRGMAEEFLSATSSEAAA